LDIVFALLPLSLILVVIAIVGYIWAVRSGQFDDLDTPALRVVLDEESEVVADPKSSVKNK
jgi:cbb3-type cytochrome oxidase maturation protein